MLGYLEYIAQYCNIPIGLIIVIIVFFAISNLIGEILELKGKVVPELFKIRKYFARKKQERETLASMPEMMNDVKTLLNDVNEHYSADNIAKRDGWMCKVNESMSEFEKIKDIVLDIQIDNKRNAIIGFANRAIDVNVPISEEEYERIFALHDEYDKIIKNHNLTNGQVDVSYDLIKKSYEERAKSHAFIEYSIGHKMK